MADKKFKPGDIVQIVTVGPKMTVIQYESNGDVACIWYDGNSHDYKKVAMPEACLRLA